MQKPERHECRKCFSKMEPKKYIYVSKQDKPIYHHAWRCPNCHTIYMVPRTQEMYEQVKHLSWTIPEKTKFKLQQLGFKDTETWHE